MEANELRLCNWIEKSLKSGNGRKVFNKLTITDLNHIIEKDGSFNYNPIQLTKKILLKCGFVYIQYFNNWGVKEFGYKLGTLIIRESLEKTKYLYDYNTDFYIVLKSLHQLQNLYFALTGTELEIKL